LVLVLIVWDLAPDVLPLQQQGHHTTVSSQTMFNDLDSSMRLRHDSI
jgi:hypothetical protein